jgi:hypothetical protein
MLIELVVTLVSPLCHSFTPIIVSYILLHKWIGIQMQTGRDLNQSRWKPVEFDCRNWDLLHSTVLYTKFSAVAVTSVSIMRIVCSIFFPVRFDSLLAADGRLVMPLSYYFVRRTISFQWNDVAKNLVEEHDLKFKECVRVYHACQL